MTVWEPGKAPQCHEEALAITKALGDKHSFAGVTLGNIGLVQTHRSTLAVAPVAVAAVASAPAFADEIGEASN